MAKMHAIKLASTANMDQCDWLALRRKGIGSSDIAAACGMNKWKGPYTLWLEKRGEFNPQPDPNAEARMEWGKLVEPLIAQQFVTEKSHLTYEKCNFVLQHPTCSWALANLDGIIRDASGAMSIIEIKNVQAHSFEAWGGEIPIYYMMQIQHQLWVTGLDHCYFVVCVGGTAPLRTWSVSRDEAMIANQAAIGAAFWSMVESGVAPQPDEKDSDAIGKRYSKPTDGALPVEIPIEVIQEYQSAQISFEIAEARVEAVKNRVKELLRDASVGMVDGQKAFTWNYSKGRETLDTKALKASHPDIAAQFTKQHDGSRMLRYVYADK